MAQDSTLREDVDLFFDSRDCISSPIDSCPGSPARTSYSSDDQSASLSSCDPGLEVWVKDPGSLKERRYRLMEMLGVDTPRSSGHASRNLNAREEHKGGGEIQPDMHRVMGYCGAVLRNSRGRNEHSSCSSSCEGTSLSGNGEFDENLICRKKNSDDGSVFVADDMGKDGCSRSHREVGPGQILTVRQLKRGFCPSSLFQRSVRQEDDALIHPKKSFGSRKFRWLRRLSGKSCILDKRWEVGASSFSDSLRRGSFRAGNGRVKVHLHKKQEKEFSAVYRGQQFKAHDGAILTMKFSPDGQYLATGGEDGVVRVWHVTETEGTEEIGIHGVDPSCVYFKMNQSSELQPLCVDIDKKGKPRISKLSSDSVCVIIPPVAFQLLEVPLHEFYGHDGEVLDLSWSNNKTLLSSSVDKTVRMWEIGPSEKCLKVFPHNDYVTSVQFNPANEDYFLTGSIDGKVRIWEIPGCHVVDWVDVREIVTAVCYRPDGKGVVVGTLKGNCRFYDASDNHLQLDAEVSPQGKKTLKRVVRFQFCPSNPHKLLVSFADSPVLILDGIDVVCKLRAVRHTGGQISASFTADGKHIISASEDSNVYMWDYSSDAAPPKHSKNTWSSECFRSSNAMIAIPWCGSQSIKSSSHSDEDLHSENDGFREQAAVPGYEINMKELFGQNTLSRSSSCCFSLSHEFLDFSSRSSATWPEEKLPWSAPSLFKSYYKYLTNACQNTSHAWGQTIVTAGSDGWISTFHNYGLPQHHQ